MKINKGSLKSKKVVKTPIIKNISETLHKNFITSFITKVFRQMWGIMMHKTPLWTHYWVKYLFLAIYSNVDVC